MIFTFFVISNIPVQGAAVPVHDPSIVVVYKDANGNSYPVNDTNGARTKYYYVFGTQLGAAYSKDMINWTSFTPTMNLNGSISTNYYQIFKAEADYAKQLTTSDVRGNLWAPDVIFNPRMNKWCMYFSLSGHEFKSSIVLLTADRVEGPYTKVGSVVHGGFTNNETSIGRADYTKVTGSSTIDARYLRNGTWFNDYGVSCIDPAVLYDENGQLWMNYGSWSGGIFLLKLDENTGLRDYNYNYGLGSSPVWAGARLRYDPYLGIHIAGGYYVSGEGPYIEYIKDKNGVGYYYLFVSMGFYSPEGGYTMRVFRSSTIDGVYTDVTGNDAVFDRWIFNYGNNTTYGFPIMQNYKWNWWADGAGEIAQGHNSVLQEEDGSTYLIYHRKFDNGTAFHNVEVHQLFFNEQGWPLSAPFEYRERFGLTSDQYGVEDIAGLYGIIVHNSVDYANLATNKEQQLYINADGSLSGAYTGTWGYNYANGKQYITLTTNAGTFYGVVTEQLMNDVSSHTLSFSAMNPANERALWGYRYTNTATTNTTIYSGNSLRIGTTDYTLAWDAFNSFHQVQTSGDFEVELTFSNYTQAIENWHNWAVVLENGVERWHLRADAFSNTAFTGSTVGYKYNWNWDTEFKQVFANQEVKVKISKVGTVINVIASVQGVVVYSSTATNAPSGNYKVYLGGDSNYMDVKKVSVSQLGVRQLIGTVNDDGTYTSGFNVAQGQTTTVSGDFELNYTFNNYHNAPSLDNWDNFILRVVSGNQTSLLRADAFMLDAVGNVTYTYDWAWEDFLEILSGANVEMKITRVANVVTYNSVITARNGEIYHYNVVNSGTSTGSMTFNFTGEECMVDLLQVENVAFIGEDCNGINGGAAYTDYCGTCVGGTTGLEACIQDCAGNWGGDAYIDDCEVCVGGTTGFDECRSSMEAEETCTLDGTIDNNNLGFSGEGFVNTTNAIGSEVSWILNADMNLTATISFNYANGSTTSRDGNMTINGVEVGNLELAPTGSWTTWTTSTLKINLVQGANEIVLSSTTINGLANLDLIYFSEGVSDSQCGLITNISFTNTAPFHAYPNPTASQLYLNTKQEWVLFNSLGVELNTGEESTIDLSRYPSGIYFIKVGEERHKIIKE